MEKTRIGVIGLGGVAQLVHLPNLCKMPDVIIPAVAEINNNRLSAIADKFNVKERYKDYKEMLSKSELDGVIISTPTNTHKQVAIDCLTAGKHVLVEKPLARSAEEVVAIVSTAKKYKKNLMVGMNLRYRPDAMLLKSLINSGEIGEPFYLKCGWIRRQSSESNWFTQKKAAGGGVILDLGILLLDLSLWLMNFPKISSVSNQNFSLVTKSVEDTSISFIKCSGSKIITMEMSWSLPVEKDSFYFNVFGSKGNASLNPFGVQKKIENQFVDLTPSYSENPTKLFKKSYENELRNFIAAIKGLSPILSSGEEAIVRSKVIDALYKSAEKNKEIIFSKNK